MAEKKNFVIRIDAATHKALEKWAADDFRSVNGQIEYLLNKSLHEVGRLKSQTKASTKDAQANKK